MSTIPISDVQPPFGSSYIPPFQRIVPPPPSANSSSFLQFFQQRSFRRLIVIMGIGTAVALAFSAFRRHLPWANRRRSQVFPETTEPVKSAAAVESFVIDQGEKPLEKEDTENANVSEEAAPAPAETVSVPPSNPAPTAGAEVQPPPVVEVKKEKLTLFQIPRGYFTPCASPFGLRLETFIRMARIEHEVQLQMSTSNSTPWIKVGDEEVRNHDEIIKYLVKKFNVNLEAQASSSRKTAARLVDNLFESKLSWGVSLWRWVYDEGKSVKDIQYLPPNDEHLLGIRDSMLQSARYQGMGRRTKEDVVETVSQGLTDAAAALGKHPYFLGDSPGEVDCHAFAILAQMVWNMPGSPFEKTVKQIKPLMDYVIRMRETFYPDWDQLIMHSAGQVNNEATKNADKNFGRAAMPYATSGLSVDPNSNFIQNPGHPSLAASQIPQPVFGQQRVPMQHVPLENRPYQPPPQMHQRQGYPGQSNIPLPVSPRFVQYTGPVHVGVNRQPYFIQDQRQNVYTQQPRVAQRQAQAHFDHPLQIAAAALTRPRTPANFVPPAQFQNNGVGF